MLRKIKRNSLVENDVHRRENLHAIVSRELDLVRVLRQTPKASLQEMLCLIRNDDHSDQARDEVSTHNRGPYEGIELVHLATQLGWIRIHLYDVP